MPYRILVVEDSPQEAERLRACLVRYANDNGVAFNVEVLGSALEFVNSHRQADLVFLDIQLPGINGMEAAQILRTYDEQTPVIFVTNLAQYAIKGYSVNAVDFILKPVEYGSFSLRMDRAMRVVRRAEAETIALPTADGIRVVRLAEVVFVDIVKHDLHYHLADGGVLHQRGSISRAASELEPKGFLKIAASCLVNMANVTRIRKDSVVMSNGEELFFSRSRRKAALEALAEYVGR